MVFFAEDGNCFAVFKTADDGEFVQGFGNPALMRSDKFDGFFVGAIFGDCQSGNPFLSINTEC